MKVLIVHNKYRLPGGEEETTRLEILSLRRHGHELIEYYRDSRELDSGGAWQLIRAVCASFYSRRTVRDLEALVARHAPDVAHVHNVWPLISPSAYVVLNRLGVPVVQTMHNYRFLSADGLHVPGDPSWEDTGRSAARSAAGQVGRLALSISLALHHRLGTMRRCIDRYVYLTEDGQEVFRRFGYDDAKASIKPNFVDAGDFQPAPTYDDTIVYLGRLAPEKGVHVLLEAMRLLPEIRLLIVGSGPEEENLRGMQKRYAIDNVRFLGSIPGVERFDLLRRARLAVIPSCWREPMSRVTVEAASCGVPVIASRVGGLRYTIIENETGLLVPPGESAALANAIRDLYHDEPRLRRMREGARAWAVRTVGEEKNYDALVRIYSLAIEQRPGQQTASFPRGGDERVDVCGLHFSKIGMADLLSAIERRIGTQQLRLSLAPTDSVVLATRNLEFRRILNSCHYLLADGTPVVWAARFLGTPLPERVAGPELFEQLLDLCRRKSYSVFFFGSDEETIHRVRQRLPADVRVAGHLCPEFSRSFDFAASAQTVAEINRAEPDILFVVLGAPKQDRWIHANGDAVRAKVIVPIGAAFDWYAGRFVRAPKWMQRCGLEWLGRLVQNPRRLWRRYARDLIFPFLVLRHRARSSMSDGRDRSVPPTVL